ncbi:MAG: hypothetical protein Q8P76_03915 [bacterium]|nr:hypothetical protein [bacterium]
MDIRAVIRGVGPDKKFLLVSYNLVWGFKSGIQNGGRLIICAGDSRSASLMSGEDRFEAVRPRSEYDELGSRFVTPSGQEVRKSDLGLVVVYAGFDFKLAIDWARILKKNRSIIVWVVACDCDWGRKKRMIEGTDIELIEARCGGDFEMGNIAREILTATNPN